MKRIFFLLSILTSLLPLQAQNEGVHETAKQLEIFNSIVRELHLYYVDSLDAKDLMEKTVDYMLYRLDPYTEYYPKEQKSDIKQLTTGQYGGIGSPIHVNKNLGRCIFAYPFEGMPADQAGIRTGDVIMRIDGKDTGVVGAENPNSYNARISESLRGKPGTTLEVSVERPGTEGLLTFRLTRRNIEQPTVTYSDILQDSVGYILLNGFTQDTHKEFRNAFSDLKQRGAKRLIIDLRFNPGGLIREAIEIVNFFIPRGKEVVSIKGKSLAKPVVYKTTKLPLDETMPIAVIVNNESASASEITAGVLQDYDRAVVVGQRTFGKGLVQETHELPYGTTLKLTTNKYFIPSGRCVQALDYKNRDNEGRPTHLPDSLAKIFHTRKGRPVRDGGGVMPDIAVAVDSFPNLLGYLASSDELTDYVVDYRRTHPEIAAPKDFRLSREEYAAFRKFLKEKGFTYDRQTKKYLANLRDLAKFEGYEAATRTEFEMLEKKLQHNEDADFTHWESEIRKIVEGAIVADHYYERGRQAYSLRDDKELREALRILCNEAAYRSLLAAPEKGRGAAL